MLSAKQFNKQAVCARQLTEKTVREAVDQVMADLTKQQQRRLSTGMGVHPTNNLGGKMLYNAFHQGSYDVFLELLNEKLSPLGYIATQSHDGGGIEATYVVKQIPAPRIS